ncbi:DNA excision repair protein ERCC-8-like isoform X3 [Chenopodium quinoa]|uniref:DNA excision repair protein ERCC-8-like isoform X3 n=1 Tax=Chenopodium quinoa TaxID=63459 RepID=UPI000B784DDB|nr:DNA excision repair protein ERCC-8-like isoform X3 [Chenopodium quinoa]
MLWKDITSREDGKLRPNSFSRRLRSRRISSLHLSNFKEFVSPHRGAVNSLQVDLTEGRYLLSAASDASAAVFDVQRAFEVGGSVARHKSLFVIDKEHQQGHKYAVSSATWYPIDTGLFITGSYDHHINVWDTNTTQVVMNFKMPGKVYKTAMSPIATSHMLIASGTEDVQVRLCDIASGAFAHTLSGHRDGVMAVEWSTSSEWILMTGGCDGAIRYWDIRRAGCFLVLDQAKSQLGRRQPLLERSVAEKAAISKPMGQNSSAKNRGEQKKVSSGNSKQRRHFGMMSSQNHATAHYGAVTGLKATEDGMYLLSAGSDSRLRLWDIESGCNTLVNFETGRLQNSKGIQFAVVQDSSLVFVPCMTSVKAFDLWSGKTSLTFRAHYDNVNSCWFNAQDQELYTGGNDRQILVWSSSELCPDNLQNLMPKDTPCLDREKWNEKKRREKDGIVIPYLDKHVGGRKGREWESSIFLL